MSPGGAAERVLCRSSVRAGLFFAVFVFERATYRNSAYKLGARQNRVRQRMFRDDEPWLRAWNQEATAKAHSHRHFAPADARPLTEDEALSCKWFYCRSYARWDLCGAYLYHPEHHAAVSADGALLLRWFREQFPPEPASASPPHRALL